MAATIYSNKKHRGPGTHVLVIGVGHYAHLPGGAGRPKYSADEGLTQLKSPPVSAKLFARWMLESFRAPGRELASLALLVSEKAPSPFDYTRDNKPTHVALDPATMPNVEQAILEWRDRGHTHADNLLVFYFCGHGLASGTELALLMQDFGAQAAAPLNGALNFRATRNGMSECLAREQVYFIDACRGNSDLLVRTQGHGTRVPVQFTGTFNNPTNRVRLGPTFYSTLPDAQAYAKPGQPSIFTSALLEALKGAGSGDEYGQGWQVRAPRLQEALDHLMQSASEEVGLPTAQIPSADDVATVHLNTLEAPMVPVLVKLDPPAALGAATLRCESAGRKEKRMPTNKPWRLSLPPAQYDFFADCKIAPYRSVALQNEIVRPPFWAKSLKVSR